MKILFFMDFFFPTIGGIEVMALDLLPALKARGHELAVACTHTYAHLPDVDYYQDIPIYRFQLRIPLAENNLPILFQEQKRLGEFLRAFTPNLIHLFGFGPFAMFYLQTRHTLPAPSIVTLQIEDSFELQNVGRQTLLHQVLTTVDWVTSVSRIEVERLIALMPELASRISCIYNAVDIPTLEPTSLPDPPRLLCIGRLARQKRFDLALRAFARIHPVVPHARLSILGDGTERAALEQLASDLDLNSGVDFPGWIEPKRIPEHINQATAVVLPSDSEGLPLVGVQTGQMARPLIGTRVGGVPELIVDGETGLLTAPGDVDALANAMRIILTQPTYAAALGHAARQRVKNLFSLEKIVDSYDALYTRVVEAVQRDVLRRKLPLQHNIR